MMAMFNWSRFSAMFLAAGIGISETFGLVSTEPLVIRYALMAVAVGLLVGATATDGQRRLGVLLGAWGMALGVFLTGFMYRFDPEMIPALQRAPMFLLRMSLGLVLCVAGIATLGWAMARRAAADLRLPDDTQYQ